MNRKRGYYLIDGKDIRKRSIGRIHHNLGYVLQTPFLFSGSVKDNIRFGKHDATDEEIIAAAKLVNVHDFIMSLEQGYDTDVNEGGSRLSTGEKQLISFARAVLSNPRLLILDEATSSIDTQKRKKFKMRLPRCRRIVPALWLLIDFLPLLMQIVFWC